MAMELNSKDIQFLRNQKLQGVNGRDAFINLSKARKLSEASVKEEESMIKTEIKENEPKGLLKKMGKAFTETRAAGLAQADVASAAREQQSLESTLFQSFAAGGKAIIGAPAAALAEIPKAIFETIIDIIPQGVKNFTVDTAKQVALDLHEVGEITDKGFAIAKEKWDNLSPEAQRNLIATGELAKFPLYFLDFIGTGAIAGSVGKQVAKQTPAAVKTLTKEVAKDVGKIKTALPTLKKVPTTQRVSKAVAEPLKKTTAVTAAAAKKAKAVAVGAEEAFIAGRTGEKVIADLSNVGFSRGQTAVKNVVSTTFKDAEKLTKADLMRKSKLLANSSPASGEGVNTIREIRKVFLENTTPEYIKANNEFAAVVRSRKLLNQGELPDAKLLKELPDEISDLLVDLNLKEPDEIKEAIELLSESRRTLGEEMSAQIAEFSDVEFDSTSLLKTLEDRLKESDINIPLRREPVVPSLKKTIRQEPEAPDVKALQKKQEAAKTAEVKAKEAERLRDLIINKDTGEINMRKIKSFVEGTEETPNSKIIKDLIEKDPKLEKAIKNADTPDKLNKLIPSIKALLKTVGIGGAAAAVSRQF